MAKAKQKTTPEKSRQRQLPPDLPVTGTMNAREEGDSASFSGRAENFPEFVSYQLQAIRDLKIDAWAGRYPKHKELQAYFEKIRCSNGKLISPRLAKVFATACRPAKAMDGGNW
jgi:hypothetical protein